MRIFFFLLVLSNILFLVIQSELNETNKLSVAGMYPEKIKLLPSQVACLTWGNLFGVDLLSVRAELSQLGLAADIRELSAGKITVHWVSIPPLRSEREIKRQINRLNHLHVPYLHVQEHLSSDSEWHNAISFGMFREQSVAIELVEELKKKGILNVNINKLSLEQVKLIIREPTEEVQESIYRLTQQFPDSKLESAECERF